MVAGLAVLLVVVGQVVLLVLGLVVVLLAALLLVLLVRVLDLELGLQPLLAVLLLLGRLRVVRVGSSAVDGAGAGCGCGSVAGDGDAAG